MAHLICRAAAAAGCKDEVHSAAMVPGPCVCLHIPHCVRLQAVWMELPAQTDSDIPCSTMHLCESVCCCGSPSAITVM